MSAIFNPKKEQAAALLADGELEIGQIAEKVGVSRMTLLRWRKEEKFSARVDELVTEINEQVKDLAIARKMHRVRFLSRLQARIQQAIDERAVDPSMATVPGGGTGLVVRKVVASAGQLISYEYAIDTATVRQLQSIQEQVAKELGQIVDKREVTGKDGGPIETADARDKLLAAIASTTVPADPGVGAGEDSPGAIAERG